MKQCGMCRRILPLTQFYFRSRATGRKHSTCKDCYRGYARSHYRKNPRQYSTYHRINDARYRARNRELVSAYLERHPCVDCGEADPRVLEFDHVRGVKHGNLSEMVSAGFSEARIMNEIEKCEVRCANCHRRKTAMQFQWFNRQTGA